MYEASRLKDNRSFIKWVGGKKRNLKRLSQFIPHDITTFVEPFVGSGAMYFNLQFDQAIINDQNSELINAYIQLRDHLDEVIAVLKTFADTEECFMRVRAWDRDADYLKRDKAERAARLIFLNKTCFNGLYRVSSRGYFNTPYGHNPEKRGAPGNFCDEELLKATSDYLNNCPTRILNLDYFELLNLIPKDAFVYLDPPYFPLNQTSFFTSYTENSWGYGSQQRLHTFCEKLDKRGIKFMQSNSSAPEMFDLYKDFNIETTDASRTINSDISKRSKIKEIVITNYDPYNC